MCIGNDPLNQNCGKQIAEIFVVALDLQEVERIKKYEIYQFCSKNQKSFTLDYPRNATHLGIFPQLSTVYKALVTFFRFPCLLHRKLMLSIEKHLG